MPTIPTEAEGLKITVAHGSDDVRKHVIDSLAKRHHVISETGLVTELKQLVMNQRPDLIITGIVFPDGDGIETVIEIGHKRPMPSVIVTAKRSIELVKKAMRDHVMAYLLEPLSPEELEAAIVVAWSRFSQLEELEGQVEDLLQALEHRKVVERAKGVLMAEEGVTEDEAFGRLRSAAQDKRARMVDIAQEILDSAKERRG